MIESKLISLLDDGTKSPNMIENIDVPAEKRARLASPVPGTSGYTKSNIQTILSNILSSDEDDTNSTDDHAVLDKFVIWKGLINEYSREKRISMNEDPLLWWKLNTKFKPLNLTARQYLSCPPSSVASEQLFSGAGLIYNPLRNRLEEDKAAKLLFIKYNLLLLD